MNNPSATNPGIISIKGINDYIFDQGSGRANINISSHIYAKEAITVASYPFTLKYHILITPNTEGSLTVIFEAKNDAVTDVIEDLKDFVTSLVDHQIRYQLDQVNGKIRDLIVAHAFSPLDLQKEVKSL